MRANLPAERMILMTDEHKNNLESLAYEIVCSGLQEKPLRALYDYIDENFEPKQQVKVEPEVIFFNGKKEEMTKEQRQLYTKVLDISTTEIAQMVRDFVVYAPQAKTVKKHIKWINDLGGRIAKRIVEETDIEVKEP